jgi:hypothetical protein
MFQTIASLQTGDIKQKRTEWAEEVGVFRQTGDYFYFVGCLPYFDVTFHYLDLADSGYYVHLIEKSPAIGGSMAQLDKTFPTNDCAI